LSYGRKGISNCQWRLAAPARERRDAQTFSHSL